MINKKHNLKLQSKVLSSLIVSLPPEARQNVEIYTGNVGIATGFVIMEILLCVSYFEIHLMFNVYSKI